MPQPEFHIRSRRVVWLMLVLAFVVTAVIQLWLAVEMGESWGLWAAGGLALAATGCGIAAR